MSAIIPAGGAAEQFINYYITTPKLLHFTQYYDPIFTSCTCIISQIDRQVHWLHMFADVNSVFTLCVLNQFLLPQLMSDMS